MPTDSLTGAIANAFLADSTLTSFFGSSGIYLEQADEGAQPPYVIQRILPGGKLNWDSGGFGVEETQVEFGVFGSESASAESGAQKLMTTFDAVPSVISFGTGRSFIMAFMRQTPFTPEIQEFRDESGGVVFGSRIAYQAMIQRQRS